MGRTTVGNRPGLTDAAATISGGVAGGLEGQTAAEVPIAGGIVAAIAIAAITVCGAIPVVGETNIFDAATILPAIGQPRCTNATTAIRRTVAGGLEGQAATEIAGGDRVVAALANATIPIGDTGCSSRCADVLRAAVELTPVGDRPRFAHPTTTIRGAGA